MIWLFSIGLGALVVDLMWESILELKIHAYMHHPSPRYEHLFIGHYDHHTRFPPGGPYRMLEGENLSVRFVQKWFPNAVVLVALSMAPLLLVAAILAASGFWNEAFAVTAASVLGTLIHYVFMEYMHIVAHAPPSKAPRSALLRSVSAYHHRHHANGEKNLNVANPFADWIFGRALWK